MSAHKLENSAKLNCKRKTNAKKVFYRTYEVIVCLRLQATIISLLSASRKFSLFKSICDNINFTLWKPSATQKWHKHTHIHFYLIRILYGLDFLLLRKITLLPLRGVERVWVCWNCEYDSQVRAATNRAINFFIFMYQRARQRFITNFFVCSFLLSLLLLLFISLPPSKTIVDDV